MYLSPRIVADIRVPGAPVTGCGSRALHFRPDRTGPRVVRGAYVLLDPAYPTALVRGRAGRVALAMGGRVIMVGRPSPSPTLCDDIPAEPRQTSPLGGGRPSPSPADINPQLSLEVLLSVVGECGWCWCQTDVVGYVGAGADAMSPGCRTWPRSLAWCTGKPVHR